LLNTFLHEMTWEDFGERSRNGGPAIIIPVGSTEQHGPHLPLGTDTLLAVALARDASSETGAVVAPPLSYGWSPHHMVLPGTVTVRPEVLIELLYDVLQSLVEHGCRKFVLLNGHRVVNISWLQIAAERAQRQLKVRVVIFDPAYMSRDIVDELGFGPLGHAEEIESSHLWFCYPDLYRPDRAMDFVPDQDELYRIDPRATGDTLCYVPSTRESMQQSVDRAKGTSGCPTKASRDKGKVYHQHLVRRLIEVIKRFDA